MALSPQTTVLRQPDGGSMDPTLLERQLEQQEPLTPIHPQCESTETCEERFTRRESLNYSDGPASGDSPAVQVTCEGIGPTRQEGARSLATDSEGIYLAYKDYSLDRVDITTRAKPNTPTAEAVQDELNADCQSDCGMLYTPIIERSRRHLTHQMEQFYLQNNASQIRFATVSNLGRAQVCSRAMDSFSLENMHVERLFLSGADWIGFLGYRLLPS